MSQSPDIGQNSDKRIYDFQISGQFLINENCCNSRTTNDIDMKLGPVSKLGKRNTTKIDSDVMLANVVVKFLTYDKFGAIWKLDPGAWSVKLTFSLIVTFYVIKTENKSEQSLTQLSYYCCQ